MSPDTEGHLVLLFERFVAAHERLASAQERLVELAALGNKSAKKAMGSVTKAVKAVEDAASGLVKGQCPVCYEVGMCAGWCHVGNGRGKS